MKVILLIILGISLIRCNQKSYAKADIVATIDYNSSGCFGGETSSLIIVNSNGKMSAVLKSNKRSYTVVLDNNKIQSYNQFIKELKTQDFGIGCTTEAFYSVKTENEKIEKMDGGCSWNGFNTLRHSLFYE